MTLIVEGSRNSQVELILPGDNTVIGSGGRYLAWWWSAIVTVEHQHLPLVRRFLESVQVEGDKIVEKVALYLAAKNVDFRADDVQRVAVSP